MDQQDVLVSGIVIPYQWDPAGNVTGIAISTAGEDEYLIQEDEKGRQLLRFIHEPVEIQGQIGAAEGRLKSIQVKEYRLPPRIGGP
jgi:hypothetical protein